ncbi:MAG: hypothetical protein AAGI10_12070 [Pseudomonadota bacterium]
MNRFTPSILALTLAAAPTLAFAAGGGSSTAPKPTATTTECEEGQVYDEGAKACVKIEDSSMNMDESYDAVRELAYAGRYADAQLILATMDPSDDRVQTYWGFTHRKLGNMEKAMVAYYSALVTNPDNLLVRSYMGQAYLEMGAMKMAQAQLTEIVARGGLDNWPAKSLAMAIRDGKSSSY